MIGSLPQSTAADALKILDEFPLSIPTWPQLPKRSFKEAMIPQYSEGLPGIKIDENEKKIWLERNDDLLNSMAAFYENVVSENLESFAMSEEYASGFHAFIKKLEQEGGKHPFVKGQVTGPFTFGLGLNDRDGKAVWFDEQYREVVVKGLTMKALWQIDRLKKYAEKVIIFFDEPIFSALGTPAYLGIDDDEVLRVMDEMITACRERGAIVGTHCCGNMDWGLLSRSGIDIIAFDAYFYGEKLLLYAGQLRDFFEKGGILAWGLVPTNSPEKLKTETDDSLKEVYSQLVAGFIDKGLNGETLRKQILFTPSCGLGSLPVDDSPAVLRLLEPTVKYNGTPLKT